MKKSIKISLLSVALLGMAALAQPTKADELQDVTTEVTTITDQINQLQTEKLNLKSQIEHVQGKVDKSNLAEQNVTIKTVIPTTVNTLVDGQKNKLDSLKVEAQNLDSRLSAAKEKLQKAESKKSELEKKKQAEEELARKVAEEAARQEAISSGQVVTGTSQPSFDYASAGTYPTGECTWGVKVMVPFVGPYWGNANQWADSARREGYRVGTKPIPGSIIVWTGGGYGHVAYVTDVQSETSIQVLESNIGGHRTIGNYRGWFNPLGIQGDVFYIYPN